MSSPITRSLPILTVATVFFSAICFKSGIAEEPVADHDPARIVSKAMLCFNEKHIYSGCEESYRLSAGGNLAVPFDGTDAFCGGACLTETHLVLDCIDGIFPNFEFLNQATVGDVRETIHAGCGYGPERGNFNVVEHMEAEGSGAPRAATEMAAVLGLAVALGLGFMLM